VRIYLDHAATTPVLPEVVRAMEPWIEQNFGNPSSLYMEGREARSAIDAARAELAKAKGCEFGEIVFTSSGTEAANLAVIGAALGNEDARRNRILFSAAEHHCVLNTAPILSRLGYMVELVPVGSDAAPDVNALAQMMGPDVLLVACMAANNELGTITDLEPIRAIATTHGALFYVDAVQVGFVKPIFADLVSYASHKLNGPKGAGALYVRAGTKVKPTALGGGQEREMRAGTEDTAAIAGFAEAVALHGMRHIEFGETKRLAAAAFVSHLRELNPTGLVFTVDPCRSDIAGGFVHLRFEGAPAESMLISLDRMGVSASSGAACSSGSIEPSHVLLAAGFTPAQAAEGLRFTFGVTNKAAEGIRVAEILAKVADRVRGN
jgi:cysteine desulfurase